MPHRVGGRQRQQVVGGQLLEVQPRQIIPRDTGRHYGSGGPFRLYTFADEPSVASAEYMTGKAVISDKGRYEECVTSFGLLQGEALSEAATLHMLREMVGR
ncbi:Scr1 family TA system antitoxin-like transcriptional regulator [Nocardiopsis sp. LOL_012]|uniref:Scr1 family TA system antitoxin-like transcriptional regulator n=1 Tax=Nocardiopsis sp. LOL_012 TaxID=3345409 RepID=UPI003A8B5813